MASSTLKTYYWLAKPGIVYGNLLPAVAGFLLASSHNVSLALLAETIVGLALVIGSACVWNNLLDRRIDAHMTRTKQRALVTGKISDVNAILYTLLLGVLGFTLLAVYTNLLATLIALVGFFDYVVVYGLAKRGTVHSTVIGSISGAVPPVVGYTAVTNRFDTGALILFLILVLWQMPHFYAIAIYRFNDYKAAGLPILTVKKGFHAAKIQVLLYIITFTLAVLSLTLLHYTGWVYALIMLVVCLVWFKKGLFGLRAKNDAKWARGMFLFSLVVIALWSTLVSLQALLP